jgi:streptogramin lyase
MGAHMRGHLVRARRQDGLIRLTILIVAGLALAGVANGQSVTEFPIATSGSLPDGITTGSDGNLWFVENVGNNIGRITPAGVITEFPIPTPGSHPREIAAGPDGNLWFTEGSGNNVGRVTTSGSFTEFVIPTAGSFPSAITAGPDGNLWFTEQNGNKIGRISTAGVITEFLVPTAGGGPQGIAAGPDGNLWFAERNGNNIGRITTAGVITEFTIPTAGSGPDIIAAGLDGNLWFTEFNGHKIGRITPGGVITEFTAGAPQTNPAGIASGPDGNLWYVEGNNVARITPSGVVSYFPIPTAGSAPARIEAGPDGSLWFTEQNGNKIGRITTGAVCNIDGTTLCLSGDRFKVQAHWATPDGRSGAGQAIQLTSDTGYFWFFGSNNVEMVTKVLNACGFASRIWVFAGGLTNVQVDLTVTDTLTAAVKTYRNPQNTAFLPIQDTSAFATCSALLSPSATEEKTDAPAPINRRSPSSDAAASERAATGQACVTDSTTMCLSGGRFRVQTHWATPDGRSGQGQAVMLTSDTGYFWFFSSSNVEMIVKVLNACGFASRIWVFAGGLTNVQVDLTVTDTQTGAVNTYRNPQSTAFLPIQDTNAFSTCP